MKLSYKEQTQILNDFPNVELSYEKKLHKKVQADIYLTIPKGKKYFVWFRNFKKNPMCFFLEINKKYNRIENIIYSISSFDKFLTAGKGTILYGTMFYINKKQFFNIENIYYFKGHSLYYNNQLQKFKLLGKLMRYHIKNTPSIQNSINFGIPILGTNYYQFKNKLNNLPYDIYCIQYRLLTKNKPFLNEFIKTTHEIFKIFLIKPTIIDDIYELYFKNGEKLEKYKYACIPDYKTSVLMNSLFRNIKENKNLDLLEESDDDEEFENIDIDKFVYLDKKITMKCVYVKKFDSWKPIKISTLNISPRREIICYKKK
jgi:hypothetical protein